MNKLAFAGLAIAGALALGGCAQGGNASHGTANNVETRGELSLSENAAALWVVMEATGSTSELCHSYQQQDDEFARASFAGGAALAAQQAGIPVSDLDVHDMLDSKC